MPAMGTGPGSEKLGVCPRPRYLLAPFMLRLISKPVCDGASSGLGVLGVCYLLRRSWRRRKTALETDGVFGKHKRSSGLVCNFPLLRGLLYKMLWTAVLLCLSGRCLYGSRSVLFYYGIIQVLCYQKKVPRPPSAVLAGLPPVPALCSQQAWRTPGRAGNGVRWPGDYRWLVPRAEYRLQSKQAVETGVKERIWMSVHRAQQ